MTVLRPMLVRSKLQGLVCSVRRNLGVAASPRRAVMGMASVMILGLAAIPLGGSRTLAIAVLLAVLVGATLAPTTMVALGWGVLLPIEVVTAVPFWWLDAARYGVATVLLVRVAPTEAMVAPPWRRWAALLGTLASLRIAMGLVNHSRVEVRVGLVMLVGLAVGLLVVLREDLRRPVLMGLVAGVLLSAVVVVMQVLRIPTLAPGVPKDLRYPGLATQTTTVTWQLATAVAVGLWSLVCRPVSLRSSVVAGPVVLVCGFALVACGAQGGMLGVLAAGAVLGPAALRLLTRAQLRVVAGLVVASILLFMGMAWFLQVDGIPPKKGFINEITRWDAAGEGLRTVVANPVTGVSAEQFRADHRVLPHTLPIESGVAAGALGFGLGVVLVVELFRLVLRGYRRSTPDRVLGATLGAVIFANTFVEAGAFVGLGRVTLVLLAVAAGHAPGHQTTPAGGSPVAGAPGRSRRREQRAGRNVRQVRPGPDPIRLMGDPPQLQRLVSPSKGGNTATTALACIALRSVRTTTRCRPIRFLRGYW